MRFFRMLVAPAALFLVLTGTGCEPSDPKKPAAKLPPQATAPTATTNPVTTDPTPKPAAQPAAVPSEPVDALIARADKLYQTGTTEYQNGHLEAARQSFD